MKLPLGLTIGDPGGVGPWVAAQLALAPRTRRACRPVVIGDASLLRTLRGLRARVRPLTSPEEARGTPGVLEVLHVPHPGIRALKKGGPSRVGGQAAALALRTGAALCLQSRLRGLWTGPVSKESLAQAGLGDAGQTEMLGRITGAGRVEMVMMGGRLTVVLATRHVAFREVPRALSPRRIGECIGTAVRVARAVSGVRRPRVGVCALNPHGRENSVLSREEAAWIAPAVRRGWRGAVVEGPRPADSLFGEGCEGKWDAIVAMYHDQAMIALKVHAPEEIVNLTVGLPFLRVSPGHGTAFELVGRPGSIRLGPGRAALERLISFARSMGGGGAKRYNLGL